MEKLYKILLDAQSEGGATLNVDDVTEITHVCFEVGRGKYDGSDSHVPSEYYRLYPEYLKAHEIGLHSGYYKPGTRVLVIERNELMKDVMNNYEPVVNFISWHLRHDIDIKRIDPDEAKDLSSKYEFPETITDVGIWQDKYVLLFNPLENGKIKLYMRFTGDKEYNETLKYFDKLVKKSQKIDMWELLQNGATDKIREVEEKRIAKKLFGYALAYEWEDFVNCKKRIEKEKDFLDDLINKYSNNKHECTIFDAAVGTGCEDRYLLKEFI